jgi:hypothetical protein
VYVHAIICVGANLVFAPTQCNGVSLQRSAGMAGEDEGEHKVRRGVARATRSP